MILWLARHRLHRRWEQRERIFVMQAAHYRSREHERTRRQSMSGRRLPGSHTFLRGIRYPRPQRTVRTPMIVMSRPLSQNRAEMYLRHRDHPIETLSSYRPDHALESSGGDPGDTVRPAALAEP